MFTDIYIWIIAWVWELRAMSQWGFYLTLKHAATSFRAISHFLQFQTFPSSRLICTSTQCIDQMQANRHIQRIHLFAEKSIFSPPFNGEQISHLYQSYTADEPIWETRSDLVNATRGHGFPWRDKHCVFMSLFSSYFPNVLVLLYK